MQHNLSLLKIKGNDYNRLNITLQCKNVIIVFGQIWIRCGPTRLKHSNLNQFREYHCCWYNYCNDCSQCCKFSFREDIKILSMYFDYFVLSPLEKRSGPPFEQIWIPCTKECVVPSSVEFCAVIIEKISMINPVILLLNPFTRRHGPSFDKLEFHSP